MNYRIRHENYGARLSEPRWRRTDVVSFRFGVPYLIEDHLREFEYKNRNLTVSDFSNPVAIIYVLNMRIEREIEKSALFGFSERDGFYEREGPIGSRYRLWLGDGSEPTIYELDYEERLSLFATALVERHSMSPEDAIALIDAYAAPPSHSGPPPSRKWRPGEYLAQIHQHLEEPERRSA